MNRAALRILLDTIYSFFSDSEPEVKRVVPKQERPSNPRSNQRNCTYSSLNYTYIFLLHGSIDDEVDDDEENEDAEEEVEDDEEEEEDVVIVKTYVWLYFLKLHHMF